MTVNGEDAPAVITQGEWDTHTGELAAVSGLVRTLGKKLDQVSTNLGATNSQMRSLGTRIEALDKSLRERDRRLDKLDDWKEDTGRHELEKLQQELADVRDERKKRFWFWMKVLGAVVAAAEAGLVNWLHWGPK